MHEFHLVQTELTWEDPAANRDHFDDILVGVSGGTIILPEMFSTGFSMASSRLAESMDGDTVRWMADLASRKSANICGSLIIESKGHFYNRFTWITPDGEVSCYDKRHLFRMADEHHHYSAGEERTFIRVGEMTLLPQVCYDLRFPVFSRNSRGEELIIYVANWPAARREQWLALLRARAIENLCYVIGVNRIGTDGNNVSYSGDSCVVDFTGELIEDLGDRETIVSASLDLERLRAYRENFPAHLDADKVTLQ